MSQQLEQAILESKNKEKVESSHKEDEGISNAVG